MKHLLALLSILLLPCAHAELPTMALGFGGKYYINDVLTGVQWQYRAPFRYVRLRNMKGQIECFKVDESLPPPDTAEWEDGWTLYSPLRNALVDAKLTNTSTMTAEDAAFCLTP